MKTTVPENELNWSHGSQACLTQWNYEPRHKGQPKTDGSWWRVLTKRDPLEKGMANHFNIIALRTPWTVWRQKDMTLKDELPRWVGAHMLVENSREITLERMKRWSQSENNAQLKMWLVMEVKSDAVKNNIAQEPGMLGPWIKVNWKWSNRRCQEWTSTF